MALVVKSSVKASVAKTKMRISGGLWKGLDEKVERILMKAAARAKANGRKTLRDCDL